MRRILKSGFFGICLAAGFLVTAASALFGWFLLYPRGCRIPGVTVVRHQTLEAREAIDAFIVSRGRCPESESALIDAGQLNRPQRDRWGQGLFYRCLETSDDLIVSVHSAGPDRTFGTADDIVAGD